MIGYSSDLTEESLRLKVSLRAAMCPIAMSHAFPAYS